MTTNSALIAVAMSCTLLTATALSAQETAGPSAPTTKSRWEFLVNSGTLVPTGVEHDVIKRADLSAAQLALFDGMHVADRRHGLAVVASLRAGGDDDRELLLAGLLHDAGKGRTGFVPRVVYSLTSAYGTWIAALVGWWPGMRSTVPATRTPWLGS